MHSLAEAARLIDATGDDATLDSILLQLGFPKRPLALDTADRERLGLPESVLAARVTAGEGSLRALLVKFTAGTDIRAAVSDIARNLSARVPHLIWLVLVTQCDRPVFAVATWLAAQPRPRILALITARGRVVDSDAETLCALAACTSCPGGDVMRHLRWTDVLGRDAVTRRFFRAIDRTVETLASSLVPAIPNPAAREVALLSTSRLLFLSFLETKGWLNGDFGFLANGFADCMALGGSYQRRVLEPLFFGTLNTRPSARAPSARKFGKIPFLNGGLFARAPIERLYRKSKFSDDALGSLFGELLVRYRFTAREDARTWSEAAIDPEMLGKAFESLMAAPERKRNGVYYTPQEFVQRLTVLTLSSALTSARISRETVEKLLAGERADSEVHPELLARVSRLRILDPACGSGAFLVHTLERLATLRVTLGDTLPIAQIRRSVLMHSIFGVDVNPIAVWLCELRLWLSTVIDSEERDPMRVAPLPNLDRQIRVGDSLAGTTFEDGAAARTSACVATLRQRYARSTGPRKRAIGRILDRVERDRTLFHVQRQIVATVTERAEIIRNARSPDLFQQRRSTDGSTRKRLAMLRSLTRRLRAQRIALERGGALPFAYSVHFADVACAGGFDVIIGNPPWVRIHNISKEVRTRYRESYRVCRLSAWQDGARESHAGTGFGGQTDIAALFIERSHDLLAPDGTLGLLVPVKLWLSLAGGGVRQFVSEHSSLVALEDWSDGPPSFDAAVYPSLIVATRRAAAIRASQPHVSDQTAVAVQRGQALLRWTLPSSAIGLDGSAGSPWLLLPSSVRDAFDCLASAGTPLSRSRLGRPWLGVKSGYNAAFVVRHLTTSYDIATIEGFQSRGEIEHSLLRPVVRGETLTPWTLARSNERIIWTHDEDGQPLRELPAHAYRWLSASRRVLESRSDARSAERWWSLFRLEAANATLPRVVWSDFGRFPRAAILAADDHAVPLNTCYVVRCPTLDDARTFAALVNSPLVAAWLSTIAEPARGGYKRYLGWTMSRLPLPLDWERARTILSPLAERAVNGEVPSPRELQHAVLEAYRLRADTVAPLLEWASPEA